MKPNCRELESAIWEAAADGGRLPDDLEQHIRSCSDCSKFLAEAERALELIRCASPYPKAPDCRKAVLERMALRRRALSPARIAWAAPLCAAVLAAAVIVPIVPSRKPAPGHIAEVTTKTQATEAVSGTSPRNTGNISTGRVSEPPKTNRAPAVRTHHPSSVHRTKPAKLTKPFRPRIREAVRMASVRGRESGRDAVDASSRNIRAGRELLYSVAASDAHSDAYTPGYEVNEHPMVEPAESSVEMVSVKWSAEPSNENLSYEFTEKDHSTGIVTTGSVSRSGDSIEIRMESTPAEPRPVKRGEISNENTPGA